MPFSNIIGKNTKVKLKLAAQNLLLNGGMMIVVCVRACLGVGGNRKLKKTTTMMATRTSPNKRFKEQKNSCARRRYKSLYISLPSSAK